jgi:hypothetical protein
MLAEIEASPTNFLSTMMRMEAESSVAHVEAKIILNLK